MFSLNKVVLSFGLLLFLSACTHEERTVNTFYNIDSLVTSQINNLAQLDPQVAKEARINTTEENTRLTLDDTVAWKKELDVFRQLDLNKAINLGNYKVEDGIRDKASNLVIKEFTSTKDLPVVYLKVYYQDHMEDVRKIEGLFHEDNALYSSKRYLSMELNKVENENVVISYSISGGQKMILGDSVDYSIKATLTYPN